MRNDEKVLTILL